MRARILFLLCTVGCSNGDDRDTFTLSSDPSTALDDGGDPRQVPARSPDSGPGNAVGGTNTGNGGNGNGLDASTKLDATTDNPKTPDSATATPFACQTSNDCTIANVGSCCGYFPRCANAGAIFTAPDCTGGNVSTCGFPAIDSCACQAGQCVGLQAGVPVTYP